MPYTPPSGDEIEFSWAAELAYTPDSGSSLEMEWPLPTFSVAGTPTYHPQITASIINVGIVVQPAAPTYRPAITADPIIYYDRGTMEAPLAFEVVDLWLYHSLNSFTADLEFKVVNRGFMEGDLEFTVHGPRGQFEAPLEFQVYAAARMEAPLEFVVTAASNKWTARVFLGGADVSARVTGTITVEAEEGTARIAEFTLVPNGGPISPLSWSTAPVLIDFVKVVNGVHTPIRIFTGIVDTPSYDPVTRELSFECTDDLQNRVAALSTSWINNLTGGQFHASISGDIEDNWQYAEECMRPVAGSLDAGANGQLRVTMWNGRPVIKEYTESSIFDESLSIDLPRRSDILNTVNCTFEWRYNRLRERKVGLQWSINPYDWLSYTVRVLHKDAVQNALEGSGWHIDSVNYTPFPEWLSLGSGGGSMHIIDAESWSCQSFTATLRQRLSQQVTEQIFFKVKSTQSRANNGVMYTDVRGSLESTWDASDWETDYATEPDITDYQDHYPDVDISEKTNSLAILQLIAQSKILDAHRTARVEFETICEPLIDLTWGVRVNTSAVQATGKVRQFVHTLDLDEGSATTEVVLAISGVGSTGLVTSQAEEPDPVAVGAAPTAIPKNYPHLGTYIGALAGSPTYSENWAGWIENAYKNFDVSGYAAILDETGAGYSGTVTNPNYVDATKFPTTGFRIILPAVDDEYRSAYTSVSVSSVEVTIPEDEFVIFA